MPHKKSYSSAHSSACFFSKPNTFRQGFQSKSIKRFNLINWQTKSTNPSCLLPTYVVFSMTPLTTLWIKLTPHLAVMSLFYQKPTTTTNNVKHTKFQHFVCHINIKCAFSRALRVREPYTLPSTPRSSRKLRVPLLFVYNLLYFYLPETLLLFQVYVRWWLKYVDVSYFSNVECFQWTGGEVAWGSIK